MASATGSFVSTALHRHRARQAQVRVARYEPTPVYALVDQLKREGLELHKVHGPWRPAGRTLRRPGRNAERVIPLVTNGFNELAVDTPARAADVSGLLNWCGVEYLEPCPNLRPPSEQRHSPNV